MPADRAAVLACARTYLGTKWDHQGRMRGTAVDCAGLVICVARDLGLSQADVSGYGRVPDGVELMAHCRKYMIPIHPQAAEPGDVLIFAFGRNVQHLGFLSDIDGEPGVIHSYAEPGRVVEHRFDERWRRRLRAAFRLPGVT